MWPYTFWKVILMQGNPGVFESLLSTILPFALIIIVIWLIVKISNKRKSNEQQRGDDKPDKLDW